VSFNGKPGERMQNNITVFSFQLASKRIGLFDAVKKRILKEKLREKPSLADFKVFAEKNANLSEARAHMLWGHFNEMRTDLETEVSKALKEVISR
ncbi:hypothetical protein KKE06_00550, partial [Candidatus Micrarchaeota archaeon]|nr:hypothetical protein [Candidatus Micrarchaeota archaeon]MBU1930578.1 hypothetical protein [Candidatus Micrarchaeota archaeon]